MYFWFCLLTFRYIYEVLSVDAYILYTSFLVSHLNILGGIFMPQGYSKWEICIHDNRKFPEGAFYCLVSKLRLFIYLQGIDGRGFFWLWFVKLEIVTVRGGNGGRRNCLVPYGEPLPAPATSSRIRKSVRRFAKGARTSRSNGYGTDSPVPPAEISP